MAASRRRRNHRAPRPNTTSSGPSARRSAWFAPPIGIVVIVGLAFAASRAQASAEIFVAAALVFSLCEGVVLAVVGWAWSPRGVVRAVIAAAATAALATPARWEVRIVAGNLQTLQTGDLLMDLLVSAAWGAIAGLAGATILRSRLDTLMRASR